MLLCRAQELSPFTISSFPNPNPNPNPKRSSLTILRHHRFLLRTFSLLQPSQPLSLSSSGKRARNSSQLSNLSTPIASTVPSSFSVEQLADQSNGFKIEELDSSNNIKSEFFYFDPSFGTDESKHLRSPKLEVKELEELPEQWRRSRLAWLCKELPAHNTATLIRVLNAQRKWIKQEDATYVAVHCLRIRENETGFRVYKWMMQQNWFRFDFALATKLADYMGKERKFLKCREIYGDIINQGLVPSESTFHVLIIAYLSSPNQGCLDEACNIYNQMIQLGDYKPRLSLHNSLFKAIVSRLGGSSKHYLKQAEFIYHNLATSGLEIHKDMYGGLIWLHSYQDTIDKERIESLRAEMQLVGIQESREVLVSILRACSKEGDVEGAERTWLKLIQFDNFAPSQAYVYRMVVYAKVGEPMKSLEIFRVMQENLGAASVAAYHKIIEVLSKAREIELAESLMTEFMESGLKPLMPCFIDLMDMYFKLGLHNKLESTFSTCLEKCRPNRTIYNLYLDSLLKIGNLDKAGEIFEEMHSNESIGVNTRSCNGILSGYLSSEDYVKAEKIYDIMCQKKYEIETPLMEKLDYVLSLNKKVVKKPINPKLTKEQREILVGLLLGGLQIDSEEDRMNCVIRFEFNEDFVRHSFLKRHIYEQYHEWLASHSKPSYGSGDIPRQFVTISHSYFRLYVDQFWPNGRPAIPKLIHRWLSPRVLAYWYMYGGRRTSSGDIVLKLKGNEEGIQRIVQSLKAKSLNCKVKRKGRVFWIGFLGSNSSSFWKLIEPHVLEDLKDDIKAGGQSFDESSETRNIISSIVSGSDSDENAYKYIDGDNS